MTFPPKMLFGHIRWSDANSPDATDIYTLESARGFAHGTMPVLTSGWILKEDDKGITLANEWFEGKEEFRGLTHIPAVNIVEVQRVTMRVPRKRKEPII